MKKMKLLLFAIGFFALIEIPKVDALRIFSYDESSDIYDCYLSGGTNDLNAAYDSIQSLNVCVSNDNYVVPSGWGKKTECETFGGSWYPYGSDVNYGSCKIIRKDVCETKGGTFYPALVTNDGPININADTTINYLLLAYNNSININAKVSLVDRGSIFGTIGTNGKIVINDNGKIEMTSSSLKTYGNTSDYGMMIGTDSSITVQTLMANGAVYPSTGSDNTDIPIFMNNMDTTSTLMEFDGNFKLNRPLMMAGSVDSAGSRYVLKDNSTLDLLSNLTIASGTKLTTGLNSKLLNSGNLTINGDLDIYGAFNNGYKLDNSGSLTATSTGAVTIGSTGKITLFGDATGTNNSINDIPVTLNSGNPEDTPLENVIQGNGPRSVTINSEIINGTVTASKTSATSGEEIILTITPATGYKVKSISVLDRFDEQPVTVTNNKFTMPGYNVYVNVVFELDIDNPKTGDNILYSVLFGSISLMGLLGVSIYLKKKRFY